MASKILIIGGTGYIGKFIVKASARLGHPTFALVRSTTDLPPAKAKLLQDFEAAGVTLLIGDLYDHESLVKAIKQVDVVISTLGIMQLQDQTKIVDAIKAAGGHIKVDRFLPSEFGSDVERTNIVEPAKSTFNVKVQIRRYIEEARIPHTHIVSHFFAGYFLPTLGQPDAISPPTDKVKILGDGNTKGIFVNEDDIGTYTIKAVEDPRTLNKTLYLRLPANILSQNELLSLWEKKVGKTFQRVYVPEEQVLKQIPEAPIPLSFSLAFGHSVFIKGNHTNFEIDPSFGVEASQLYPDVKYTTVDEYLDHLL